MGKIHNRIEDALAAELSARTGWDEAPALYFLCLEDGNPVLFDVEIPNEVWAMDRPAYMLARLAQETAFWAAMVSGTAPEGLHGAAFRSEAWTTDIGRPGTERRSDVMGDVMAHRIGERADRVEARTFYAVDRAGITYEAVMLRGDTTVKRRVLYPGAAISLGGTVPGALDQIVTGLTGVTLPARKG